MDIRIFDAHELPAALSALRHVAIHNQRFTEAERALIHGVAQIHELEIDPEQLQSISFAEVARRVIDPQHRRRLLQLAIVTSLVEGTPSPDTERQVRALSQTLEVGEEGLSVLYEISQGHALCARFDMLRRVSRVMRKVDGFPGFLRMAPTMLGLGGGDPELASRYYRLARCARGSLGRAVFDHFYQNDFKFPGEPGGVPVVFHDLGHVLAGYGTDPQSEIQQAAFQAGFTRRDGFTFLLFGILQFHLGMRITPVAAGERGLFDVPLVLEALRRGAACNQDLGAGFDLFAHQDRALDEVRAALGIPALRALAA